jgi:uncharacterized membrane protein YqjE
MTGAQMPRTDEQPGIKDLIGNVTEDLTRLFRQEMELARAELRQEGAKAGRAAAMYGAAGAAGLLLAIMLSLTIMYALDEVMHIAFAALIVAALWAVAGAALYAAARNRMRSVSPLPQTTETMKENAQWLQNPTR